MEEEGGDAFHPVGELNAYPATEKFSAFAELV
jgi:hypothetical protein